MEMEMEKEAAGWRWRAGWDSRAGLREARGLREGSGPERLAGLPREGAERRSTGKGSPSAPRSPALQQWGDPGWGLVPGLRRFKGTGCTCSSSVALEKQFFSIKHPPHLGKYTESRAGENGASPASHPSRVQVAPSAQLYEQSHPLPRQTLLSCTHPEPSMPLICNKGKYFLGKSAPLPAYHTETNRGAPAASTSPQNHQQLEGRHRRLPQKPSRETNFHFEEESWFQPVPAVICVVQLCGRACSGSTQGSQPASLGSALQGGKAAGYCISMGINKVSHGDFPATFAFMQNRSSHWPSQASEPPGCWGCALGHTSPVEEKRKQWEKSRSWFILPGRGGQGCGDHHSQGRQDQRGNEIFGLPSVPRAAGSTGQGSPGAGAGRQELHSAELVLQGEVYGKHTSIARAHPLAPELPVLPFNSFIYCSSFQSWPCLHHHPSTHPPASQGPPHSTRGAG